MTPSHVYPYLTGKGPGSCKKSFVSHHGSTESWSALSTNQTLWAVHENTHKLQCETQLTRYFRLQRKTKLGAWDFTPFLTSHFYYSLEFSAHSTDGPSKIMSWWWQSLYSQICESLGLSPIQISKMLSSFQRVTEMGLTQLLKKNHTLPPPFSFLAIYVPNLSLSHSDVQNTLAPQVVCKVFSKYLAPAQRRP